MTIISRLLFRTASEPRGSAYAAAMNGTDVLLQRMEAEQRSADPARAVMASIWRQRNNIPYMATIHEAVAEVNSPFVGTEARLPENLK